MADSVRRKFGDGLSRGVGKQQRGTNRGGNGGRDRGERDRDQSATVTVTGTGATTMISTTALRRPNAPLSRWRPKDAQLVRLQLRRCKTSSPVFTTRCRSACAMYCLSGARGHRTRTTMFRKTGAVKPVGRTFASFIPFPEKTMTRAWCSWLMALCAATSCARASMPCSSTKAIARCWRVHSQLSPTLATPIFKSSSKRATCRSMEYLSRYQILIKTDNDYLKWYADYTDKWFRRVQDVHFVPQRDFYVVVSYQPPDCKTGPSGKAWNGRRSIQKHEEFLETLNRLTKTSFEQLRQSNLRPHILTQQRSAQFDLCRSQSLCPA